jgi:hypothetical protein
VGAVSWFVGGGWGVRGFCRFNFGWENLVVVVIREKMVFNGRIFYENGLGVGLGLD